MKRGQAKNPERNAEIIRRRKAGEWPRAIARSMGVSHNVVIGVCGRAGLCNSMGHQLVLRGEDSPSAKLSEEAVRAIRRDYRPYDRKASLSVLAKRHGVGKGAVYWALGCGWAHVQ